MGKSHQGASRFDYVRTTVSQLVPNPIGSSMRRDHEGAVEALIFNGGGRDAMSAKFFQHPVVMHQFAQDGERTVRGLVERQLDGVPHPKTHSQMLGSKNLHITFFKIPDILCNTK